MANFFVILSDGESRSALRVRVTNDVQAELLAQFVAQEKAFFVHKERVPGKDGKREMATLETESVEFFPLFTISDNKHVFELEKFGLDDFIVEAANNPDSLADLKLDNESIPQIRAFAVSSGSGKTLKVYFQSFDRRKILQRSRVTLLERKGTFSRLGEVGFTLGDSLQAVYKDGTLWFRSFAIASRFVSLLDLFNEASNDKIKDVLKHKLFAVEDENGVIEIADTHMRKQFSAVADLKVLDKADAKAIAKVAKDFLDTPLSVVKKGSQDRIQFPTEKRDQKALLSLLTEGMYRGPITGEMYQSNSHRPLKKAAVKKGTEDASPKKVKKTAKKKKKGA